MMKDGTDIDTQPVETEKGKERRRRRQKTTNRGNENEWSVGCLLDLSSVHSLELWLLLLSQLIKPFQKTGAWDIRIKETSK